MSRSGGEKGLRWRCAGKFCVPLYCDPYVGEFLSCIKGFKYCFEYQEGTLDFSRDAAVGKGLILRWQGNLVIFLLLRWDLELLREPLVLPQWSPISIRFVMGSWGLLSIHCRANRPYLSLCPETRCSSSVATGISGLHSSFTQGVRPCLDLKQRNPLSSQVATDFSWSPLNGLKGVNPSV